jgi:hypothetical protein
MDWLFIKAIMPLWELLVIGLWVLLTYIYVSFRLMEIILFSFKKHQINHQQYKAIRQTEYKDSLP